VNSNLPLIVIGSLVWTACLWLLANRLTKGITPKIHPLIVGGLFTFSTVIFSYNLAHASPYLLSYSFFLSALVVTMFTDATTLLISRIVTLYSMPIGWILSNAGLLPISPLESIIGSLFGLLLLWLVRTIAHKALGRDGLGQGDIDLLCFIGAFTGPIGCWITLMTGSIIGSVLGLGYAIRRRNTGVLLPFGLFLGMGAALYILFQENLTSLFIPQF